MHSLHILTNLEDSLSAPLISQMLPFSVNPSLHRVKARKYAFKSPNKVSNSDLRIKQVLFSKNLVGLYTCGSPGSHTSLSRQATGASPITRDAFATFSLLTTMLDVDPAVLPLEAVCAGIESYSHTKVGPGMGFRDSAWWGFMGLKGRKPKVCSPQVTGTGLLDSFFPRGAATPLPPSPRSPPRLTTASLRSQWALSQAPDRSGHSRTSTASTTPQRARPQQQETGHSGRCRASTAAPTRRTTGKHSHNTQHTTTATTTTTTTNNKKKKNNSNIYITF